MRPSSLIAVVVAAVGTAVAQSWKPSLTNGSYKIEGQTFKNRGYWDFSKLADNAKLPAGLIASGYPVGKTHAYNVNNVYIQNKYLNLRVNGNQTKMPFQSAEIFTQVNNIKYASVRTVAIFAEPAGVCNGMFFYKNDNQETDIEWLSDPATQSNNPRGSARKIWFANQAIDDKTDKSWTAVASPSNPTTTEHEYRIDWTPGLVRFFIDGKESWRTDKSVPTEKGPWVFNNWANGDKGWSCGPPKTDAIFRIKEIDMYYNTA
ncbi:glycoside hydrolase family 16 protein [Colletotrichum sojae]|uniref:Glycoside hydrolase family 16 protein n=1 Tax=Colletotrichum sojae TaxID=2175907 RepID=A0A8H6IQC4_9PEZI|nr:glycoside hydrolase family 16 protein [Colletotrichum sojae]